MTVSECKKLADTHSAHTHGATRKDGEQVREPLSSLVQTCHSLYFLVICLLLFCSRYDFGATERSCAHAQHDVAALYLSGAHLDPTRRKFGDCRGRKSSSSSFVSSAVTLSFLSAQERGSDPGSPAAAE